MITFKLLGAHGQMGNQLFQYAMLKGVSAKTGYSVAIPDRFHRENPGLAGRYRWCSLQPFKLECDVLSISNLHARPMALFEEPHFEFCPDVFMAPDETDFSGFFQSPKYFSHIEDVIRREFRLADEIVQEAVEAMDEYRKKSPSLVSLHVRLSDNINSDRLGFNYMVRLPYYQRAVKLFPNSKFLVFSDNPWACRRIFDAPQFIIHDRRSQWVDFEMISMCDHHINAASTFSWWAAWLDAKKTAITVVPERWFGERCPNTTVDLLLPNWIQISDE